MKTNELKEHKLYNGRIVLMYNDRKHLYTRDGEPVQGVTSVLDVINKPRLIPWAVNVVTKRISNELQHGTYSQEDVAGIIAKAKSEHTKIKNVASDKGRTVHQCAEALIKGEPFEEPSNAESSAKLQSFKNFCKDYQVEFIDSERVIYSEAEDFCGTFDFTCKINGKTYLGDLKTGKSIHNRYFLQIAAYQKALQEETGIDLYGRLILRTGVDGYELRIRDNSTYDEDYGAFRSALVMSRWVKKNEDHTPEELIVEELLGEIEDSIQ